MQAFFNLIEIRAGAFTVDGVDLRQVNASTLRRQIVGHPQKFSAIGVATVRHNLIGDEDISDDEIKAVLDRATSKEICDDVMSKLDTRWDTCEFSEGMRQRICIIRTFLRKSSLYIMDEPTSG